MPITRLISTSLPVRACPAGGFAPKPEPRGALKQHQQRRNRQRPADERPSREESERKKDGPDGEADQVGLGGEVMCVAATHCMERNQPQQAKRKKASHAACRIIMPTGRKPSDGAGSVPAPEHQAAAEAGNDHPGQRGHGQKPARNGSDMWLIERPRVAELHCGHPGILRIEMARPADSGGNAARIRCTCIQQATEAERRRASARQSRST